MRLMLIALAFCVSATSVGYNALAADSEGKITGEYRLNQETCAKGAKAPGCEITFEISGKAAKALYEHMTSTAEDEPCTGGKVKVDNEALRCFLTDGHNYSCDVGYNFVAKKLAFSDVTC
jgi:hypothetical protein